MMKSIVLTICFCIFILFTKAQVINTQKTTQRAAREPDTTKAVPKNAKIRMVGGGQMSSLNDIIDNISKAKDLSIFINAIAVNGLSETLKSRGPITVFAPTNEAFKKLPQGLLDTLMKPAHKAELTRLLTYHVIPERLSSKIIGKQISEGKGEATFNTLAGLKLKARLNGDRNIVLIDESGNESVISMFDIEQNNGIIDIINSLLLPKAK